ncbi:hypothetical protein [Achromobacter insolitus]|uniref:hypothetical protein n=1 Tax=Achromobacter insolitus TaxID=217204 RepID=UPI0013F4D7A2
MDACSGCVGGATRGSVGVVSDVGIEAAGSGSDFAAGNDGATGADSGCVDTDSPLRGGGSSGTRTGLAVVALEDVVFGELQDTTNSTSAP